MGEQISMQLEQFIYDWMFTGIIFIQDESESLQVTSAEESSVDMMACQKDCPCHKIRLTTCGSTVTVGFGTWEEGGAGTTGT